MVTDSAYANPIYYFNHSGHEIECYQDNNGCFHRDDGPAWINNFNGDYGYYCHGFLHRLDGIALRQEETSDWYIYGVKWNY